MGCPQSWRHPLPHATSLHLMWTPARHVLSAAFADSRPFCSAATHHASPAGQPECAGLGHHAGRGCLLAGRVQRCRQAGAAAAPPGPQAHAHRCADDPRPVSSAASRARLVCLVSQPSDQVMAPCQQLLSLACVPLLLQAPARCTCSAGRCTPRTRPPAGSAPLCPRWPACALLLWGRACCGTTRSWPAQA